ncbi:protein MpDOX34 [Marchantia polymorpha subsp. ruderalis]|uniref:Fe2OG dioxygenase domain-containing protein n=2 Tax=Marchantia polymorpha TaxID=3197 RepID=A0A176VMT1_MARPO|nr:hypothetical protein AXG93_1275s1440 [Marchantia polymorpha subsp. ruderalis]PTQ29728.1 hypothetical protein MARPO_0135s0014 [Marchantia polymorpha]BBN14496.1 hypothetical protein Mp_6g12220 [Marchantia polymorpha subsp. ruderalis]|eukprot:PTQ29728.1 hypothetical protein MARPO_0135s0014 [Marchantia polymorpha]
MTYMSEAQLTMTGVQLTSSPEKVLASIADVKELNDSSVTNAGVLSAILRGFELPKIYVQPDVERKGKVHLDEDIQLPSVDLSVFRLAEDDPRRKESLATIVNSCKTWGFIQVVGHGVDLHMIKRCEAEAHRLFDLPVSVKEKVLRVPGALYGYGSNFFRNLTAMNWAESFHISHANVREYAAKLWPTEYEQFSSAIEEYITQVQDLGDRFRRILTEGLGVPRDHFDQYFGEGDALATLRLNFFPTCPEPSKALGLKSHRDPHFFTLLHQDEIGGLQIWNEGRDEWFNVKPDRNSLIINVGDILQAASNGVYRSVLHRVVVNSSKSRLSMACFYNTRATVVSPPELISAENPQRYRPVRWEDYAKEAYTITTGKVSQIDQLYGIPEQQHKS